MKAKIRNSKTAKHESRKARVHSKIARSARTRLTIFRSAKHIYAQLEDPISGRTLGTVSTRSKAVAEGLSSTGSVAAAVKVGQAVAALAREKQIDRVVFNRNGFLYHGRVKALADAAREAGLQF
jgi:large subunit ribosomal protein L18